MLRILNRTSAKCIIKSHVTRSFAVIVKSPSEYDIPDLFHDHGSAPKFVMKNFLSNEQKNLDALVDAHTGKVFTYEKLYYDTYKVAKSLKKNLNITNGDVVAIMSPNNMNYFSCFNGIALTGAASTTINPMYTSDEIAYQLNLTKAKAIIAHPMCIATVRNAISISDNKNIPIINIDGTCSVNIAISDDAVAASASASDLLLDDLIGSISDINDIDIDSFLPDSSFSADDLMTIPFSSGK
jgi:acyl-CoA synthetase (AMP-forming)/AMP-acid ligase II